jgi:hypothetical protein
MKYIVKTVDKIDWANVEKAPVNLNTWNGEYAPETYAQLVSVNGEGLALKMTCIETNPRTVHSNFFDNVYEDSCMEWFFNFGAGEKYINVEMNSVGAALIAVGPDRHDRTRIDTFITPPIVTPTVEADKWSVEVYFPLADIRTVLGDVSIASGTTFYANFYKCGNNTAIPHFITWSLIDMKGPDFHQSKYFGKLVIE